MADPLDADIGEQEKPAWLQRAIERERRAREASEQPSDAANGSDDEQTPWPDEEPPPAEPDAEAEIVPPSQKTPEIVPLEFFSVEMFEGRAIRDREWLVKDRIPMRNVTLLGGDGATGKTTIALQLFVGVTKTGEWLRGDVCQNGSVLFLTAEEEETEIHRRLDAIREARELSYRDIAALQIRCMPGQNAVLAQPNKNGQLVPTPLFEQLELTIRAQRPSLVCIESSADVFAGNEIDRVQVRHFISMLRSWSLIDGASVMLLSHPSQAGRSSGTGESGSTGWNNSVRSRLYFKIKKDKDKDADDTTRNDFRTLEVMKSNYGPAGERIECVWRNGIFVLAEQAEDSEFVKANKALNAESAFMRCLDIRNQREQWVNQEENSRSRYAPKIFAEMDEAEGFRRAQLKDAMERLLDRKMIGLVKAPNFPPSNPLKILVRRQPSLV